MCLIIVGHFHVSVTLILDISVETKSEQMLHNYLNGGLAINATISSNYVVYFVCSKEYRQAFIEQLRLIFCFYTNSCKNWVDSSEKSEF